MKGCNSSPPPLFRICLWSKRGKNYQQIHGRIRLDGAFNCVNRFAVLTVGKGAVWESPSPLEELLSPLYFDFCCHAPFWNRIPLARGGSRCGADFCIGAIQVWSEVTSHISWPRPRKPSIYLFYPSKVRFRLT